MGQNSRHGWGNFVIALIMSATAIPLANSQVLSGVLGTVLRLLRALLHGIPGTIVPVPDLPNSRHGWGIFVIALIMSATAIPLANSQVLSVVPVPDLPVDSVNQVLNSIRSSILGLNISGIVCCTPTGNCPGPPLVGAIVSLNCSGGLGNTTTTNANGSFNLGLNNIPGLLPLPVPCNLTVLLPLNQTICSALSTVNGTLTGVTDTLTPVLTTSTLTLVSILIITPLLGIGAVGIVLSLVPIYLPTSKNVETVHGK
ncbi:hypothetical protein ACS0TY_024689 [Phlomoides rotata]